MPYYAGIGSRETPPHICERMSQLATALALEGWTLRSGHALGADRAFEAGHIRAIVHNPHPLSEPVRPAEIFTPTSRLDWPKLRNHAALFHPNWAACEHKGTFVCHLHARNSAIILGPNLDSPVQFIICWTPGGTITGGTGQALRIATHHRIPVYNLATQHLRTGTHGEPPIVPEPLQKELPL